MKFLENRTYGINIRFPYSSNTPFIPLLFLLMFDPGEKKNWQNPGNGSYRHFARKGIEKLRPRVPMQNDPVSTYFKLSWDAAVPKISIHLNVDSPGAERPFGLRTLSVINNDPKKSLGLTNGDAWLWWSLELGGPSHPEFDSTNLVYRCLLQNFMLKNV